MSVPVQPVDVAATLASLGGIGAIVIGTRATRPKPDAPDGVVPLALDPEDRPARLRERLSVVETRIADLHNEHDDLEERVMLLEALRVTLDEFRRQLDNLLDKIPPPPRATTRRPRS